MSVGDCDGHSGDACLDVNQLGIEVFSDEDRKANRGTKEAGNQW